MISKISKIILVILIVSGSIIFHETAHFVAARALDVPIKQASLGFGPSLGEITHDQVTYHLRAIPLGGFVELDTVAFTSQHGKAILISLVGPLANFILFMIVCIGLINRLLAKGYFFKHNEEYFYYQRHPEAFIQLTPKDTAPDFPLLPGREIDLNLVKKMSIAFQYIKGLVGFRVNFNVLNILHQDPRLIENPLKSSSSFVGPIGIFKEIYLHINLGFNHTILSIASLNLGLGFFNLLPFPFLDGGKVMLHIMMMTTGASLNIALGLLVLGTLVLVVAVIILKMLIKFINKNLS